MALRDQLVTDVNDLVSPNPDVALIDGDSVLVDGRWVPWCWRTHIVRRRGIIRLVAELVGDKDAPTKYLPITCVHLTEHGARKVEKSAQWHRPVLRVRQHH